MTKQKLKMRYNKGSWVSSMRCFNCNSISKLKDLGEDRKNYEDKGMTLGEDKKLTRCVMMCDKGWFHSTGKITS